MVGEGKWLLALDKGFGRIGRHYYDNLLTYGSEFKLQ